MIPSLIVIAIIGAVVWYILHNADFKDAQKVLGNDAGIPKEYCNFKYRYKTPKGRKVISTVKMPATVLQNCDIGTQNEINQYNFKKPTWDKLKQISEYPTLCFIDPMAVNHDGTPAIKMKGVQCGGFCAGNGITSVTSKNQYSFFPQQEKDGWKWNQYIVNTTWYESEHIREYSNDIPLALTYTGENDVHPHAFSDSVPIIPAV